MKIDELIEQLQALRARWGNGEVLMYTETSNVCHEAGAFGIERAVWEDYPWECYLLEADTVPEEDA